MTITHFSMVELHPLQNHTAGRQSNEYGITGSLNISRFIYRKSITPMITELAAGTSTFDWIGQFA